MMWSSPFVVWDACLTHREVLDRHARVMHRLRISGHQRMPVEQVFPQRQGGRLGLWQPIHVIFDGFLV
jgi:hypothetical protein